MAEKKARRNVGVSAIKAVPLETKVIKKGEPVPDINDLPVEDLPAYERVINTDLDTHQTIADRLDLMCDELNARHYRKVDDDGTVTLQIKLEDHTVLSGQGATTREAFNRLLNKVQRFVKAGLNEVNPAEEK